MLVFIYLEATMRTLGDRPRKIAVEKKAEQPAQNDVTTIEEPVSDTSVESVEFDESVTIN